jgi:hypothetical protein
MASIVHGETFADVIAAIADRPTERLAFVDPTESVLVGLAQAGVDPESLPSTTVYASEATLKAVRRRFAVASGLADYVDAGSLTLRQVDASALGDSDFVVTDRTVYVPVSSGASVAGLAADEDAFRADAGDLVAALDGDPFGLRTPGRRRILETARNRLGEGLADDMETMLSSVVADLPGEAFDVGTATVLLAARNDALLYDVSRWTEDVGLAAKSTLSGRKTALEDAGLVTTEKVPDGIGRPQLRLLLDGDLTGISVAEILEIAVEFE